VTLFWLILDVTFGDIFPYPPPPPSLPPTRPCDVTFFILQKTGLPQFFFDV